MVDVDTVAELIRDFVDRRLSPESTQKKRPGTSARTSLGSAFTNCPDNDYEGHD